MNWYKRAQVKKIFVGDCVNGLNNEVFKDVIAEDATELAQLIENSTPITLSQFLDLCDIDIKFKKRIIGSKDIFKAGQFNNIVWLYDKSRDKHYFYT